MSRSVIEILNLSYPKFEHIHLEHLGFVVNYMG
jgi:hypothetical protein